MKEVKQIVPNLTNDEAEKFVKDLLLTKKPLGDIDFTNDIAEKKKSFYGEKTKNGKGPRRKYQLALGNLIKVSKKRWNSILEQLGLKDLHDSLELAQERERSEAAEESAAAEEGRDAEKKEEDGASEERSEDKEGSETNEGSDTDEGSETENDEENVMMSEDSESEVSSVTGSFGKISVGTPPRTRRGSRKSKTPQKSSTKKKSTKSVNEPSKSTITLLDELIRDGHDPIKIYFKTMADGSGEHPLWIDVNPGFPELHAGMTLIQVKKMVLANYQRDGWFLTMMTNGFDFNDVGVMLLESERASAGYSNRIIEVKIPSVPGYYEDDAEFLDTIDEGNTKTEVRKFLTHVKKDPNRKFIYYWLVFPVGVLLAAIDSKVESAGDLHFLKSTLEDEDGNDEKMEAVNIWFQIAESGGVEVEEWVEKKSLSDLHRKRTHS